MHIALATAIGVAVIGYFAGIGSPSEREAPVAEMAATSEAPAAATYVELRERNLGPNAGWTSKLSGLAVSGGEAPLAEGILGKDQLIYIRHLAPWSAFEPRNFPLL